MSDSTAPQHAPRIAIKFGAPAKSSKPTNASRRPGQSQLPSSLGKRPRPHALGHDSDSEQDDEFHGRHEAVTTIGARGVEGRSRSRDSIAARTGTTPLIIACQTEGVWKAAARTQKAGQLLPHEQERENRVKYKDQAKETEPADHDKDIKWGLTLTKKHTGVGSPTSGQHKPVIDSNLVVTNEEEDAPKNHKTADQDAMDALLGIDTKKKKQIVIAGAEASHDELQAAVSSAGEVSTIEEYDQIPDGEFGMAMLRGMGLKETKQNTKPKEIKRRPALLGLGAKEDEEIKKADLAKKHGHRERAPRLDEYRRGEEARRKQREERHTSSYKHERERERNSQGSSRRQDDRDRDRDRYRDRDGDRTRHHDRHSRR